MAIVLLPTNARLSVTLTHTHAHTQTHTHKASAPVRYSYLPLSPSPAVSLGSGIKTGGGGGVGVGGGGDEVWGVFSSYNKNSFSLSLFVVHSFTVCQLRTPARREAWQAESLGRCPRFVSQLVRSWICFPYLTSAAVSLLLRRVELDVTNETSAICH